MLRLGFARGGAVGQCELAECALGTEEPRVARRRQEKKNKQARAQREALSLT